jgi:putative transposase
MKAIAPCASPDLVSYTFDSLPEALRHPHEWPAVDTSFLPSADQVRFTRFQQAIIVYLECGNLSQAASLAGVHRKTFAETLDRCLRLDGVGVVGWLGLIKNLRLKAYERSAPVKDAVGLSGAFTALLRSHPKIQEDLDAYILPRKKDGLPRIAHPDKTRVFSKFKTLCRQAGIKLDEYPFNSKSMGRRSVERYVQQLQNDEPLTAAEHWHGESAAKRMGIQTGASGFAFALTPLARAQVDAHKTDCFGVIYIPGPAGLQPVVIRRVWLVAVNDTASRAVAGYSVGIRTEVSASEVEQAIKSASTPWQRRELKITGLEYHENAGFPCGSVDGITEYRPSAYSFDNAAVHYSKRIAEGVRQSQGCVVTYGPIGAWWFNAIQERFFKTLEKLGIQKIASSTGNSPMDPHKPPDSVRKAQAFHITLDDILEILDVLIANYNATPTSALGHRSPLQALDDAVRRDEVVPRFGFPPTALTPALGICKEHRPVRGNHENGTRPYVQVDKERYSSPELAARVDLIGVQIAVHIDEEDMRSVTAYDRDGLLIGTLGALGMYRHTKHSRQMRKVINGLYQSGEVQCDYGGDVVEIYHNFLVSKSVDRAKGALNKVSPVATQLAQSAQKTGLPTTGTERRPQRAAREAIRPAATLDLDWSVTK